MAFEDQIKIELGGMLFLINRGISGRLKWGFW
jgi:hypothetical protein